MKEELGNSYNILKSDFMQFEKELLDFKNKTELGYTQLDGMLIGDYRNFDLDVLKSQVF